MNSKHFRVPHDEKIKLADYDTAFTGDFKSKKEAGKKLKKDIRRLAELQDVLYAQDTYALLVIFQALDAAGKDSTIKHVMSGINPQGCQVFSFKAPSQEELDHDYLWRCTTRLPERGRIGIFNRSYYEEVLVTRVHPEILDFQKLPPESMKDIWKRRYEEINNFEEHLYGSGTRIVKFFLHVSKEEQKRRFLDRIERPDKNWKFSASDMKERARWDDYQKAYQDMFNHTSTKHAPWHIIPADHKWFMRGAVAEILIETLESLDLQYPVVSDAHRAELQDIRTQLENEA
ncbi:MAG: polyphosphate kinase 2 family protein [Bacteroidetes bacterium]|nr:polyphosphate kinase 2 family protein [Bacteroidota bacterium]